MKIKVQLIRVCDHYFLATEDSLYSVEAELCNRTGSMPIRDENGQDFMIFKSTSKKNNCSDGREIIQYMKNFFLGTYYFEKIGNCWTDTYFIEINSHSDLYIAKMQKWFENELADQERIAHAEYSQNLYSNTSTAYGGDCE